MGIKQCWQGLRSGLNVVFILLVLYGIANAYVTVPGGTLGDTIWGPGTVYVSGSVTISNGNTLTVQSNTVVKFAPGTRLTIYGTLSAVGAVADDIVFTTMDDNSYGEIVAGSDGVSNPGDWDGIYLSGFSTNTGIGHFDYCRIRYGGDTDGAPDANVYFYYSDTGYFKNSVSEFSQVYGIQVYNASPEITNNMVINNGSHGLYSRGNGSTVVTDNAFTDNGGYAVYLEQSAISPDGSNNTASGNALDGFVVSGTVAVSQIWSFGSDSMPIVVKDSITVNNGVTLTIPAGVTVKMDAGVRLTVVGTLLAVGTVEDQVVITSLKDDTYGGDTNADGAATSPAPGDWEGIYLSGFSTNTGIGHFDYCRIRYGGDTDGAPDANVYFYYSDTGYFKNSVSEFSQVYGIQVYNASPEITNNMVINNGSHGLYSRGNGSTVVTDNAFTDNGGYAVYLEQSAISPDGSNNTASGNALDGFVVSGTVAVSQIWSFGSDSMPIVVKDSITVNNGVTLTIPAGVTVKMDAGVRLTVVGTLLAVGTVEDQVVITSLKDDTYGGDTNADGAATSPAPGDWEGIYLSGFSTNTGIGHFDYCRIRYGGDTDGAPDANVYFYYSDTGYFKNSVSEFSQVYGLQVYNASPEITNSTVANNTLNGIYGVNSPSTIVNTIVWENSGEAIALTGTGTPVVVYSNIEGGYVGEGNFDADPLFTDASAGDYRLRPCSPSIDSGDPVERLRQDYTADDIEVLVDAVTYVNIGDLIWITDGFQSESDTVAGITVDTITIDNGFVNSYAISEDVFLFKPSSDFTGEPDPNGGRINMGALGGSAIAETTPQAPEIAVIDVDACIPETKTATISIGVTDPEGGNLNYLWETPDGGSLSGDGSLVEFTPESVGPHPCPYRVIVTVSSDVSCLSSTYTFNVTAKRTGDVNGDGVVNIMDKVAVRNAFGQSGPPGWIPADVNWDGVVNILDKVVVRNEFGLSGCGCE